ncbi:MAG TPA: D-aminoacyl-tRNA deacylase [Petrotogaceae bacterium]|nr:D-aminoacyl-tRNA deacylase [Petrotogaceae bacterium]HNY36489.1 D-aminoacyl-tRNA deacylase [Petrotogaceae bacterium]HOG34362.1 D-aminoacyl-tRNA deacylase [Petrotogaceae bacterium]HPG48909.1 D-aminoacyl-tRNA deacylase [Petrotogaceae bacterium]HPO26301.1 D-aminoacyl-tRNA deacylase [Petrotogaceae bacterium]
MRCVVQRVSHAQVDVDNITKGSINKGLMILAAFRDADKREDFEWMADKLLNLRIFEDDQEKMNLSVTDISGELLVISQFTLYGDCRKGRRPSFSESAGLEKAKKDYEEFLQILTSKTNLKVATGVFQAVMKVSLVNEGPVTFIMDSSKVI